MTDLERKYVRENPDKLTERKLAEKFKVSRDLIHGIRKKRAPIEVDLAVHPHEVEFVKNNQRLLTDKQIVNTLNRLTGKKFVKWWVERVRKMLAANEQKTNSTSKEKENQAKPKDDSAKKQAFKKVRH